VVFYWAFSGYNTHAAESMDVARYCCFQAMLSLVDFKINLVIFKDVFEQVHFQPLIIDGISIPCSVSVG